MQKTIQTDTGVHPLIENRWSPRVFDERHVAQQKINRMLEAARSSSSCFNEQPWRFIIGHRGKNRVYQQLQSIINEHNLSWAASAPLLMLITAKTNFDRNGKNNRWAEYDTGQAAATLTLQGMAENIYIHQMGGFDAAKAVEIFNLQDKFKPMAMVAAGYLGNEPGKADAIAGPAVINRKRVPLEDLILDTD